MPLLVLLLLAIGAIACIGTIADCLIGTLAVVAPGAGCGVAGAGAVVCANAIAAAGAIVGALAVDVPLLVAVAVALVMLFVLLVVVANMLSLLSSCFQLRVARASCHYCPFR